MLKQITITIITTIILTGCVTINTQSNVPASPTPQAQPTVTPDNTIIQNELFSVSQVDQVYTLHNRSDQTLYFHILDNETATIALWVPCRSESQCQKGNALYIGAKGSVEFEPSEFITKSEATGLVINGWILDQANSFNLKTENLDLTE